MSIDPAAAGARSDGRRIVRLANALAALLSALAGAVLPVGYSLVQYRTQAAEIGHTARVYAAFIAHHADERPLDWSDEAMVLLARDLARGMLPEARVLIALDHSVLARSRDDLPGPTLARTAEVRDRDGQVHGVVEVQRSLRPVLPEALLVAALGAALAGLIFAGLRALPLRALREAVGALAAERRRALREAENRLRIVFEHSIEGIFAFEPDGTVLSCNPAGAVLLGVEAAQVVGRRLDAFIRPPAAGAASEPFPLQRVETVARRADGREVPVEMTVSALRVGDTWQRIGIVRDITERRAAAERLDRLANYDALTGLPNRVLFRERLAQALDRADRNGLPGAVLFLDLDRFKAINDSLGHAVGDELLRLVGQALERALRRPGSDGGRDRRWPGITVARLGGDEFTVIAEGLVARSAACALGHRVLEAFAEPFVLGGQPYRVSTSVGIALFPADGADIDTLVRRADIAMYRAKAQGRSTWALYSDRLDAEARERLALEADLRRALDAGEFELHYQPKCDLGTGAVTGVEALLRWRRAGGELVPPDRFVPVLEESGLIVPVGHWVLFAACRQLVAWDAAGIHVPGVAINLSARQLGGSGLVRMVGEALVEAGLAPERLELELTESMLMDEGGRAPETVARFARLGVHVSIDDFGTGYSSLAYLKRFPVGTLKIDRSFVRDIPDDADGCAIATAIVALGRSLRLRTVAEGVETEAQAEFLRACGCNEMQGWLLARPMPADDLVAWLRTRAGSAVVPLPPPSTRLRLAR